ncbi:MAG: hypothetical protein CMC13_06110 [Flavobacteriaceae bacterium]|nr:hypothetical protein [Flavobacteriaceae bacterium]|tara:strand:- start:1013 stop:10549 length:9537 start_codon:yes stop_codon:yes gene_type:complete
MKQFYRACLSAFTTATKIGLLFGFLLFLCTSYSQVAITCPGNITANISDNPISYTAPTLTNGAIAPATIPGYTFLGSFDSSSYYLQNSSTSAQQAYNLAVSSGCTITQNSFASGNSIFVDNLPSPGINPVTINITNTLIWDYNSTNGSPNIFSQDPANTVENFNYSLVSGYDLTANNGLDGTNLANDPQFTDPVTNDFTLQPTSPVIDLGDNTAVTQSTDLNGDTRIIDGDNNGTATVDFGPFESPMVAISNIMVTASGDLEFIDNDDRDDNLTIVIDGANYRFTDPDNTLTTGLGAIQIDPNTVDVPIASVTGIIAINSLGGDDTFTTNFSGGNFLDLINYNGGTQISSAPGDILRLQGGSTFSSVEHVFINENDGSVEVAGNPVITYTGLEPIVDNLSVTDRVFTFTGADETITLSDDGDIADNESFIDSTLGENVTFTNPTNSLTINTEISGGSGADVINIEGLDTNFDADVTVNGGADDDANFQTNPTSIGSGSININARTISVTQDVSTTQTGSITLNASQNIVADSGAVVSAENGDINFGANTAATLAGINTVAISVNNSATIRTTGTGNIELTGVAVGDGTVSDRAGIVLSNNSTVQTSSSGNITVTGTGGDGTSGNHGILLDSGSNIQSNSGAVTITGTSGQGTDGNTGVYVNSEISTGGGDAIIMGTSIDAAGVDNAGIFVNANIGTNGAGNIDITGTSANAASDAITLFSFDRRITAFGGGTIHIAAVTGPLTGPAGIAPNPGPGPYSIAGLSTITLQGEIQAGNNVTGPGQLPILGFSNNAFSIGDELTLAINGVTTPGVDYSQLVATGMTVDITNTILNLVDGLAGPVPNGTTITLIENNGGPIVGTFNGLPNGATVPFNGQTFFINYNAGSGSNDVVLTENSLCAAFPANIVYVDVNATGSNDGTSWANAFTNLQDAITQINDCPALDTIYVAEGTYLPTTTTDRYTNFNIPGNCSVYGGFSPTNGAIDLGTRDFNAYPTILSGDIGVPATTADNVIHVVYITAIAAPILLDGLTIRDGFNDEGPGNPNFAQRSGAGLLIETYIGGANLTLNNCTFSNNNSNYAAGALANTRQNHTINIDNSFFTNNGGGDIGSIFFRGDEVITITNTTISNNNGGNSTMYLLAPLNLTIDNCVFDNNGAQEYNALRVDGSGTSQISNSIFRNHNATINGALGLINANMIIENSLFHDNTAARGGAIYMVSSSLEIIGCTFTRNTASNNNFGEAIYVDNSAISTLNITNSIVWDNDDGDGIDDEISSDGSITGNFNHSLIKGFDLTASNGLDGTNPANDPLFTNPATNDFTLQTASPVIDLGDNTVVTEPNDLNGNTRIVDGDSNTTMIVDFGAYEAPELADTTPPVITCPSDITGDCAINPITYPFPTATDNIGVTPATPAGFQYVASKNGKSYFLSDAGFDGPSAFADAIALGGTVATIVNQETNTEIQVAVEALAPGISFYIGLNDLTTEGAFEWQSTIPFAYENWLVGEPNGGASENYTVMNATNGFWVDIGAGFVARYILELTGGIEQIAGLPSGFNFPVGTTTNTFLATDTSGNTDTCSFDITITDSTPVTITCPADITTNNDPGLCGAYVDYPYPIPNEDCNQTNPLLLSQVDEIVNLGFDCVDFISSHVRIFDLAAEGVTNDYFIDTIRVGIAFANPAENVTVNIYLDDQLPNAITTYNSPLSDHVLPYATNTVASPATNSTILAVPINVFIPSDATIIVEVVTPETANFLMGYLNNNTSETAVGYIGCGSFFAPSDLYPAIISVDGSEYLNQTTIQTAGLSPNSLFPIGTTTNTFVVTDANGNTDTCSFNITVNDTELPVLTCPADITVDNEPLACGATVDYTVFGSENCITSTIPGFEVIGSSNKKIYYLSDAKFLPPDAFADAVANGGFVVTIEDDVMNSFLFDRVQQMAPNATPIIGYNDIASEGNFVWQSGEPFVYNNWFTSEPNGDTSENHSQLRTDGFWNDISPTAGAYRYILEIDSATLLTQTAGLAAGSEFPVGTTTNTFTYTDPSGNIGMCSFDVTVNDIEAPVAVCQDITIQLDAFGNATIVATDVDGGSTDNCAVTDYQVDIDTFTCADVGNPVTVTLTVFDDALNSDTCTAIVTVEDVTAPDITCPGDQNEDFDANCEFILPDYTALATVSDSCDTNPTVTQSPIPGTTITGSTQITLSAEDAYGNMNTCVFDVIPEDNTAPTITCPANQTEDLDANCEFMLPDYTGLATVSDSCDSNPTVTQSPIAGTVVTATTQITLFAEDVSGNINSCVFDVILQDTTAPTITCPPTQNETPDASCMFTLPDYTGLATAIDNCGTVSVTQTPTPGTVVGIGNTTITLEASDGTNISSCTFDVVVSDTSAPTITCPADQNVDYDSSCQFTLQDYTSLATTTDACDPAPIISQNPPAGTVISATTTITLTTTDASGNSDFCTFDVIPTDATPPSLNCPADQNEILDANCEFVVPDYTSLAFVIDNCDPNPLLSQSPIPGTIIATTTVITIFAEDNNGNTDSCTFTVTLEDTTPPVITCPPTQNETADANCMFTLPDYTGLATATDNCGTVSITQTPPPGTMVGSGNTSITLEASDGINTSNCTFTVIVADTTPPTAVCQDITVQLDASGMAIINAFDIDNESSDNCSIASSSVSPNTFSCADVGTPQTVTLTVTDASGNTSTCTSMVTVEDVLPPTAICQDITLILDASGNATLIPSDIDGGSSDNCGIASLSASQTAFTCDDIGPNDVILTITDDSGNTSSCTAIVTVSEAIDPIAVCQDITVQLDATGTVTILPADVDGGSSDNCGIDTLTLDTDTFTCADVGPNMVTLTVFDTSGNSSSCMAIVTVEDNVVPEAICQDITVILDANAMATIVASDVDGGSTDACGIALLEIDIDTFTCDDVGPNNVTLTVTDVNGNMSSCVAVVTIEEENITPIAVCQNVTVPLGIDGTATIPASSIDAGSTGASCSGGLSLDIDTFDCSDVGKPVTVTLTVTNGNGVTDSCTAVVNVVDTLDPSITCPDDQVVQSDGLYTLPDYVANGLVVYQDNCGPLTTVQQDPAPGTMLDLGEYLINFTATDPSGNEIDCFFRLTIEELLATNTTVSLETVTLFPNPASEFIVIANPARIELQEVAIYDMTGRLVQNLAINNAAETVVPISHLASASYMVLITSETQQLTKQLVKE